MLIARRLRANRSTNEQLHNEFCHFPKAQRSVILSGHRTEDGAKFAATCVEDAPKVHTQQFIMARVAVHQLFEWDVKPVRGAGNSVSSEAKQSKLWTLGKTVRQYQVTRFFVFKTA
jgi:hypothetical protein